MSANVISQSSSSSSPSMSSTTCGKFLPVEFTIFFFIFLTGLTSNVIFILLSFRKLVNAKGCSVQKYNIYLVHWSIANLILLVFNMPFDVITYSTSGAWFFGEAFCRLHFYVERAAYFTISTLLLNLIRDAYKPFGHPNLPPSMASNWIMSLVFMLPLMLTSVLYKSRGCTRCKLVENSLPKLPVYQWSEEVYVAILPLVAIAFYSNKYSEHPDYENLSKAGAPDDDTGPFRMQLRSICLKLATLLCVCTSPARLTEIAGGNFKLWPGQQIIFHFVPRLLIYGQTILFIMVCASHYPTFYQGTQIAVSRLWGYRQLPATTIIKEEKKGLNSATTTKK